MKPMSLCVHSYNEADALRRLVLSSLPFAGLVHEWVVVDHRSDDDTQSVLPELAKACRKHGIDFVTEREARDFGPGFVMADLRQQTTDMCRADVIALQDADFVFGAAYADVLQRSVDALCKRGSKYHGVRHAWPQVWDRLVTDDRGVIVDHGRVQVHKRRIQIFARGAIQYQQIASDGRWERAVPVDGTGRTERLTLTRHRDVGPMRDAVVSVNVKSPARLALRETMLTYMHGVVHAKEQAGWLDAYERGDLPKQEPYYVWHNPDLRGWRIHAPNLDLET